MRKSSQKFLNVAVAMAIALTVVVSAHAATSGSRAAKGTPKVMGTFRVLNWVSPDLALARTLDPVNISEASDFYVASLLHANLVTINGHAKVQGDLATHWKISKNHKVYTFYMRHNARFSNGDPVTARDVVWSIRRALAKSTASRVNYYDSLISGFDKYTAGKSSKLGVKALGKYTVQISTTKPAAYYLKTLTYPLNDVLDPKVEAGHVAALTNNYMTNTCKANVGAGPFRMVCNSSGSGKSSFYHGSPKYTLAPNPYYYGPKPKIDVVVTVSGTADTGWAEYLSGSLDLIGVPSAHLAQAKKMPGFHKTPESFIEYTSLNTKGVPFNNKDCRLAYAWGLNRVALAKVVKNTQRPWYEIVPRAFLGYFKPKGVPTYNLAKAKSYFAKGGSTCATPFTYVYPAGGSDADNLAATEVASETAVGFKETQKSLTQNDWDNVVSSASAFAKSGYQATFNGWIMDYPDPQDYVSLLFDCGVDYNISSFCSKKFDSLTKKADANFNPKVRAKYYIQAQKIALNNGTPVMWGNPTNFSLSRPKFKGFIFTFACPSGCPPPSKSTPFDWSKVTG